jgi:hypothetical protein
MGAERRLRCVGAVQGAATVEGEGEGEGGRARGGGGGGGGGPGAPFEYAYRCGQPNCTHYIVLALHLRSYGYSNFFFTVMLALSINSLDEGSRLHKISS